MIEDWYQVINAQTGVYEVKTLKDIEKMFEALFTNHEDLMKQITLIKKGERDHFTSTTGGSFIIKRLEVQ